MVVIGNYMVGRCQRVCVALQSVVCLTCFIKFCRVPQGETELVEIKGRLELRQGTWTELILRRLWISSYLIVRLAIVASFFTFNMNPFATRSPLIQGWLCVALVVNFDGHFAPIGCHTAPRKSSSGNCYFDFKWTYSETIIDNIILDCSPRNYCVVLPFWGQSLWNSITANLELTIIMLLW